MYQVRNRVYAAGFGGWLQRDPQDWTTRSNLCQYGDGNPVNSVDPQGLLAAAPLLGLSSLGGPVGLFLGGVALAGVGTYMIYESFVTEEATGIVQTCAQLTKGGGGGGGGGGESGPNKDRSNECCLYAELDHAMPPVWIMCLYRCKGAPHVSSIKTNSAPKKWGCPGSDPITGWVPTPFKGVALPDVDTLPKSPNQPWPSPTPCSNYIPKYPNLAG